MCIFNLDMIYYYHYYYKIYVSTESLLFLTEYTQLKNELKNILINSNDLKERVTLLLPNDIPKSIIVETFLDNLKDVNNDNINGKEKLLKIFHESAKKLYNKYIQETAGYQVNISHHIRQDLICLCDNNFKNMPKHKLFEYRECIENKSKMKKLSKTPDALISVLIKYFEEASYELTILLNDSFSRFKNEDEFFEYYQKNEKNIETVVEQFHNNAIDIKNNHKRIKTENILFELKPLNNINNNNNDTNNVITNVRQRLKTLNVFSHNNINKNKLNPINSHEIPNDSDTENIPYNAVASQTPINDNNDIIYNHYP